LPEQHHHQQFDQVAALQGVESKLQQVAVAGHMSQAPVQEVKHKLVHMQVQAPALAQEHKLAPPWS